MEGLQNRLDSFSKAKRVKNTTKPSYISVKWPHPSTFVATPEALADAGFYFNPSYDDRDTVTCFVCEKNLGGWEAEDDPLDLHWSKCGALCCWAAVRCGLRSDINADGSYVFQDKDRVPTSPAMERARLETFSAGKGWVHDRPKNHGANSSKMARAGFVFTPQEPGDDLATCLYCNVSLSGWEPEDNPLEEHRRRDQKGKLQCPFFTYEAGPSKPPSKSKAPRSRQSSRQRTTSSHQDIIVPIKDDTDNESVASTSKTKGSRGRSSSRTSKKLNRSQSRATLGDVAEDVEEAIEEIDEAEPKPKKKASKAKKSIAANPKGRGQPKIVAVSEDDDVEMEGPSPVETAPSQGQETDHAEEEETKTLKKSNRGRRVTRAASAEVVAPVPGQRPTRGRKKQPTPIPDPDPELAPTQDIIEDEDVKPGKAKASTKAPKTSRKPSRTKAKPTAIPPEEPEIAEEEGDELVAEAAAIEAVILPSEPLRTTDGVGSSNHHDKPSTTTKSRTKIKPNAPSSLRSSSSSSSERRPQGKTAKGGADVIAEDFLPPLQPKVLKPVEEDTGMDDLPPLYIPKRGAKQKPEIPTPATTPAELPTIRVAKAKAPPQPGLPVTGATSDDTTGGSTKPERKAHKVVKLASTLSVTSVAPGEASDALDSEASDVRKPLTKRLSKAPARKTSSARQRTIKQKSVVEISSEDESDKERKLKSKERKERAPSGSSTEKPIKREVTSDKAAVEPEPMAVDSPPTKPHIPVQEGNMKVSSPPAQTSASSTEPARSPSPIRPTEEPVPQPRSPSPVQSIHEGPPVRAPTPPVGSSSQDGGANEKVPSDTPKAEAPAAESPPPGVEDVKMASPPAPMEKTLPIHAEPPCTPPRQPASTFNPTKPKTPEENSFYHPPLSRLPFTRMASLTDAELDMTVEEWVRYQMELEYDKFRRDGERELTRFKKAAEDVRGIIEGL